MATSFHAHLLPSHVLSWGFSSWCSLTEICFKTGCLQIPSALQQQMSGSFRNHLAAPSPLFSVDQLAWLQETSNNRDRPDAANLSFHGTGKQALWTQVLCSLFLTSPSLRSSTSRTCTCLVLMASRLWFECGLRSSFLTQCRGTVSHLRKSYSKENSLAFSTEYRQSNSGSGWGTVGLVTKCREWEQN